MHYSVGLELFEPDGRPLNILKFNSLNDLVGKRLKLTLELRKAADIPEKLSFEVQAKYQWLDEDATEYSTEVMSGRAPPFAYKAEHEIEIDDDLISKMIENTLRVGVYGKVE